MATTAQRQRLIEGLAFIQTHRRVWNQGDWVVKDECGAYACLAGHIAVTLNPSKPVIKVPIEIWKKPREERTAQEQELVYLDSVHADKVVWTKADGEDKQQIVVNGKTVDAVHVSRRAKRLIGDLDGEFDYDLQEQKDFIPLFSGSHDFDSLIRNAAIALGLSQAELKRQMKAVIEKNNWGRTKVSA